MTATLAAAPARAPGRSAAAALVVGAAMSAAVVALLRVPAPRPWVELASVAPSRAPATPGPFAGKQPGASAAPRALPDRAQFRTLLARVRSRWARHTLILTALNPMAADVAEAARLADEIAPGARADHAELARICDVLSDAYPEPRTAPDEALFWLTRAAAARFFAWTYQQVITQVQTSTAAVLARGHEHVADPQGTMASFASMDFGRDGVVLIRRYMVNALPLFEQMAAAPDRAGPDAFDVLFDARELARFRGIGRWSRRDDDELRRLTGKFKEDLARLPGPTGSALSRLLARFWEWGDPLGKIRMTRQTYTDALTDLAVLAEAMPGARASVESLARHMRDEMAAFPAPRPK